MIISLIVALDEGGGIGHHGHLPWRLSSDLKRFKALTLGHHMVMGRKTYESIGRPLPGRTMIVVTRQQDFSAPGCLVVHSLQDAIALALEHGEKELFIIGGGELYRLALPFAWRIYLTLVHTRLAADVFFPGYHPEEWRVVQTQEDAVGEKDEYAVTFQILERIKPLDSPIE